MIQPIAPPPSPVNYQFPTGQGILYVPILDGVAGRLRYTNNKLGDKGFTCGLAAGRLITKNMATTPAPLEVTPWSPGSSDTWAQSYTDVVEDAADGIRKVLFTYNGGSLPAMASNANPGGWALAVHPWLIHDAVTGFDGGFEESYGFSLDGSPTAFFVAFVPYFKIVAASTTPSLLDGTDQTWYLYFAKPLNSNQTQALLVSVTTAMFGATVNLATSVVTNSFGQATALKVTVPLGSQHPASSGNQTISVGVNQNLTYLKGDVFVTEAVTLIAQNFNVNVTLTADTTPPTITGARIVPKAQAPAAQQAAILQTTGPGPVGTQEYIASRQTLEATITDSGSGLDRVELWVEYGSQTPFLVSTSSYGGAKGSQYCSVDLPTLGPSSYDNPVGQHLGTNFLFKAYDVTGNVASAYALSFAGGYGAMTVNPSVLSITPTGGTYSSTNASYSAITGVKAIIGSPSAFVSKVEVYVDSVLVATVAGSTGVADANGGAVAWGDFTAYSPTFAALAAGAHTIRVMVYDAVPNGAYSITHTHYLDLTVNIQATITGTGGGKNTWNDPFAG